MNNLPMLIKRCLTYGVRVLPFQINDLLRQYELKKIPDDVLSKMNERDLAYYVKGLCLCAQEMSGDWTRGHEILKELGFEERRREQGHRCFVSLVWPEEEEINV